MNETIVIDGVAYELEARRDGNKWVGAYTDPETGRLKPINSLRDTPIEALDVAKAYVNARHKASRKGPKG